MAAFVSPEPYLFALCYTIRFALSVIPALPLPIAFFPHLPAAILLSQDFDCHTFFEPSDVDPAVHPS